MSEPVFNLDYSVVDDAARGHHEQLVPRLTPITSDMLMPGGQRSNDYVCPLCHHKSFFPSKDFANDGRVNCHDGRCGIHTGGIRDTVAKFGGYAPHKAAELISRELGIWPPQDGAVPVKPKPIDIIAAVAKDKRMPLDAFRKFNPIATTRGRSKTPVARVPIYNELGESHSYFDFAPGHKGWFARGDGMSGMFFPDKLPQQGETCLGVEGCKDAAALIGLGFNACGLPTSYMPDKYARLFAGVHVVLVPDLDTAGQLGAQRSGGHLSGIAASVKVARLPGEILEKGGDDVRDVLARDGGEKLVRDAIENAEPWTPREGEHDPRDGRPEVLVTLNYGCVTDQVTTQLGKLGWASPWISADKRERLKLYQRGGALVHVVTEDEATELSGHVTTPAGTARIRPLPLGQLPLRISDACQLVIEKESKGVVEKQSTPPPRWLMDGIFTRGEFGRDVRPLTGIITAPTLRSDGTILQAAGYDTKTGLLHIPGDKFPVVPAMPTLDDAKRAVAELREVVTDFEFFGDADSSAWIALVLSQIGRTAITGCVPLFAITATTRGSGKSLLSDAASLIAFGRPAARKPYSSDDDEQRKAITATAIEALQAVLLDNVDRVLGGASLDAALTATTWSDRVLGSSRTTGELPLRTVWTATGNNLRFGSDIARRVLPIRLQATVENPEERTDFAHPDLLGWVRVNRPRLAIAALIILRAYFVAGKPKQPGGTFGSFEAWSDLIRGAIVWTGLADPLKTRETAKVDDTSGAIVRGLIGGLLEIDEHGKGMTAREIVSALNQESNDERFPAMREAVAECGTFKGRIDSKILGFALRKYRGRIANGFQIGGKPNRSGVIQWTANRVDSAGDAGHAWDPNPSSPSEVCVFAPTHIGDTHSPCGIAGESSPASPASPALTMFGSEVEL